MSFIGEPLAKLLLVASENPAKSEQGDGNDKSSCGFSS